MTEPTARPSAAVSSPPPPDRAACICGHTEQQHFEDVCITELTGCACGDFLPVEAAAEEIARLARCAAENRLALSQALGLGTGAPWSAIRERAAELRRLAAAVLPPTDRGAVLREAADHLLTVKAPPNYVGVHGLMYSNGVQAAGEELRRLAAETQLPEPGPTIAALDGQETGTVFSPGEGVYGRDPYYVGAVAQQQPNTETRAPRCDHCKQPGHSFEDCPRADQPATPAVQPAAADTDKETRRG